MNGVPALECRNLSKTYRKVALGRGREHLALNGVSLSLGEGECLGVVGLNGSGKSTLVRHLLGLEDPDTGEVLLQGRSLDWHRQHEPVKWRRHMQVVFQDSRMAVNPRFTVEQILREPLLAHGREAGHAVCRALLDRVGLEDACLNKRPGQCSGGQLQRICIARALALDPGVLLLDEAVTDLDLPAQAQILALLAELGRERRLSLLFVSHDLRAVFRLCQRVVVLDQGSVVTQMRQGDDLSLVEHPAAQALLASLSD